MDQAEFMFFSKCKLNKQFNTLQYLVLGYKPGQDKYKDLNYILSLIGLSIFKAYCVSENRKKVREYDIYCKIGDYKSN